MRLFPTLFAIFIFALSACKEEAGKYETIGKFTVELDGKAVEFISVIEKDGKHNDIKLGTPVGVKTLWLSGAANTDADGAPDQPLISVVLQAGAISPTLKLQSVDIYDQAYTKPLHAGGRFGKSTLSDLVIGDAGEISFSFTADLVRVEMTDEGEKLLEGEPGIHIEGTFSGTIATKE